MAELIIPSLLLRTEYSKRKINLCYAPLRVTIVHRISETCEETVSMKDALKLAKQGVHVHSSQLSDSAKAAASKHIFQTQSLRQRMDIHKAMKELGEANWLDSFALLVEKTDTRWNKSGIKLT